MAKHPFLSDDWFAAVEQLVEQHGAETPNQVAIVMNLTVTDTPFGNERTLHLGARNGRGHWGIGHAEQADVTLTTDYETAKRILLAADDPTTGLQAFMEGKVKIQGDMAKLMAAQAAGTQGNPALSEAIQAVTE